MSLDSPADVLILTNGPGEVSTWVRPVVQALRQQLGTDRQQVRISVVLSPCNHANGHESEVVQAFPEVDRVQAAEHFWPFLLWGQTVDHWEWRDRGVVLFLGGDQFFAVVLGRRLGYATVVYAEWSARWWRWIDSFGVVRQELRSQIPERYAHKLTVVGDLLSEAQATAAAQQVIAAQLNLQPHQELIGFLPGSKPAKLSLGVPLAVAIAESLSTQHNATRFVIPVAPGLTPTALAAYADPDRNPAMGLFQAPAVQLIHPPDGYAYLQTATGTRIDLWTATPAYDLLSCCRLCLTTVGANTAELTALTVPMLVLLPTQQLDVMRAWDGIPGLLANLPGVGQGFARLINWLVLRQGLGLRAWPNIWAGCEIVPELVGQLQPAQIAARVEALLNNPEQLTQIQTALAQVRGKPGAASQLAQLVQTALAKGQDNG